MTPEINIWAFDGKTQNLTLFCIAALSIDSEMRIKKALKKVHLAMWLKILSK